MPITKGIVARKFVKTTTILKKMVFEVIPKEQTPRVPEMIEGLELFMIRNIDKLLAFKEYAETRNDAVGLAANQCAIFAGDSEDEDGERFMARVFALRDLKTRQWRLIIDPHITEYVGIKETNCEGCLTWKGQVIVAERSRGVMVSYYDEEGKPHRELHHGFEGQIWQHEINHLNGVEEKVYNSYEEPKPIEVGRNEKCPCGSGKKYKQCCLLLK
jgi:peptide deformylase